MSRSPQEPGFAVLEELEPAVLEELGLEVLEKLGMVELGNWVE